MWRNDISLCVPAGPLTWCWSSDKAAVFLDARLLQTQQFTARRSQHSTSCDVSLDIRSVLCRPVTEEGSLSSSVSSVPKYTEDTLVFAFIPCNFIWLSDFALSLCYHSRRRSCKQVTWASINQIRLLFDWWWLTRNQLKLQLFHKNASLTIQPSQCQKTIPYFHYYTQIKRFNPPKSNIFKRASPIPAQRYSVYTFNMS